MGSSTKKHKSEKKKKRSRSPERTKEKHRHHKRHHRDRKRKVEIIETEDLVSTSSDSDVEEIHAPPPPKISRVAVTSPRHKGCADVPPPPPVISDVGRNEGKRNDGKAQESLSIEETNKLRAKLGLKPLQVSSTKEVTNDESKKDKETLSGGKDMGEFIHKPADNISDKLFSEKIKERLTERREKREIEKKLKSTKTLGEESDSEDDDATAWVKKSRQKELERKQAEARAKMLEELDQEFGVNDLVEEEIREDRRTAYTSKDLKGLKVEHSLTGFNEGNAVILTLKDKAILDEDGDVLVNVNMVDDEKYKKNILRRKQKPGAPLDNDEPEDPFSESSKSILSKYDEEISGEHIDSFLLGKESSQLDKVKRKLSIKSKLMAQKEMVSLNTSGLKLASDYYTEEELKSKFKKPSTKVKKIRKKPKMLKAEDLIMQDQYLSNTLTGHKNQGNDTDRKIKVEPVTDVMDVDDLAPPVEDLSDIKIEPDESEIELQLALSKARKIKLKSMKQNSVEEIAKDILENSSRHKTDGPAGTIVLNSTAEFCRTLGDIPTYGLSGNREEDENEILDFEREIKEEKKKHEEEKRNIGAWNQVPIDERSVDIIPNEVPILDAEPDVGAGVAGALRLALSKGYLEKETDNRPSASRFAHLQAQNYSIEDKTHGDDEKFGRRERYVGPTTEFKEKDNYKPNVKLDYIDDEGRILNAKEAFRYLSHKFHGKGPGKNKVEKRMKKNEQEGLMKQMSSTDTPLGTLIMLQQKQKETQSPYVILSGNKQVHSTTISKSKH